MESLRASAKVGLFQKLGRKPQDKALASKVRPAEPRMARAQYLKWVKAFFALWRHAVADALDLRFDARIGTGRRNPLLRARWNELVSASGLPKMLDRVTRDVNAQVSKYYSTIFRTNPPRGGQLAQTVAAFRQTNIDLVSKLGEDQVADLTSILEDANAQGLRHEEIAGLLEDRIGVGESRAKLIARDQTLKYNSSVHVAQAEAAGLTEFVWSTSHDGAVRPMHRELDGKRFRYDDPPVTNDEGETNLPGEDYQCRCQAIPVIPLFDGIENETPEDT